MTDDYEDLAKLIAEIKTMYKKLLPPMRLKSGYEIVATPTGFVVELEIVDILQDMALEDESGALEK